MADDPNLADICHSFGHLAISKLAPEIQWMIVKQAVQGSDKVGVGCLAAVNKRWQNMVESLTFDCIKITLTSQDSDGPNHFMSILTAARTHHLKALVIKVEWPFYLGAQDGTRFSGSVAIDHMSNTIWVLSRFFDDLQRATINLAITDFSLVLQAIKPSFVPPRRVASARVLSNRRFKPAAIDSSWQHTKMQKLSARSKRLWAEASLAYLPSSGWSLPIVTKLDFPPDFFHPSVLAVFLSKFPNLGELELNPMCKMGDPEGWHTELFSSELTIPPLNLGLGPPNSAPKISTLILGRTPIPHRDDNLYHGNPAEDWSRYFGITSDPRFARYIKALRDYTKGLKKLIFKHFAAETEFYVRFLTDPLPTGFQWEKLEHLHIRLYGEQVPHGKRIPQAIDYGEHLSLGAQNLVTALFNAAGTAVARMPRLQTMTIHIPRNPENFLRSVTLQFGFQKRKDGRVAQGIWGSISLLEFWAAPIRPATEAIWRRSVSATGRKMYGAVWHAGECPDFEESPDPLLPW